MNIYCISDIHGCFEEFIELLQLIDFDCNRDKIYVLGDVIDRGDHSIECLKYIKNTKGIFMLLGNHEIMMLNFFDSPFPEMDWHIWSENGGDVTARQLNDLSSLEQFQLLEYIRKRPLYKTVNVDGKKYFLSHAGLDPDTSFKKQETDDLTWGRSSFYDRAARKGYICIFGHTPTRAIRGNNDYRVWVDKIYKDKICIDSGCIYGGALAALRLNDLRTFYVKPY